MRENAAEKRAREEAEAKQKAEEIREEKSRKYQPTISSSIAAGAKQALRSAGNILSGGMAGKAKKDIPQRQKKTDTEIEKSGG